MFGFGGGNKSDDDDNNKGGGNGRHGEASPLLLSLATTSAPSNASGSERSNYYFLGGASGRAIGTSDSVRDTDGGEVVEGLPPGATTDEFAPKVLGIPAVRFGFAFYFHIYFCSVFLFFYVSGLYFLEILKSHYYYYYYYFTRTPTDANSQQQEKPVRKRQRRGTCCEREWPQRRWYLGQGVWITKSRWRWCR